MILNFGGGDVVLDCSMVLGSSSSFENFSVFPLFASIFLLARERE
jgi:hypothetical protein